MTTNSSSATDTSSATLEVNEVNDVNDVAEVTEVAEGGLVMEVTLEVETSCSVVDDAASSRDVIDPTNVTGSDVTTNHREVEQIEQEEVSTVHVDITLPGDGGDKQTLLEVSCTGDSCSPDIMTSNDIRTDIETEPINEITADNIPIDEPSNIITEKDLETTSPAVKNSDLETTATLDPNPAETSDDLTARGTSTTELPLALTHPETGTPDISSRGNYHGDQHFDISEYARQGKDSFLARHNDRDTYGGYYATGNGRYSTGSGLYAGISDNEDSEPEVTEVCEGRKYSVLIFTMLILYNIVNLQIHLFIIVYAYKLHIGYI